MDINQPPLAAALTESLESNGKLPTQALTTTNYGICATVNQMGIVVTEANASERLRATVTLLEECYNSQSLALIWVDSGYSGENFAQAVMTICGAKVEAKVEVVKRSHDGFEVLLESG